jgi:periplasmic protein CpxP/Spy
MNKPDFMQSKNLSYIIWILLKLLPYLIIFLTKFYSIKTKKKMNNMKRVSFLVMAIIMVFSVSCNKLRQNSQEQQQQMVPGGGMGPGNFDPAAFIDRQMEELNEGLDLSDDQEKQVREILTAGSETMRKAREEMQDGGGDREAMREKMQQMREEQNEKIKTVLSEEQFTKYEQIQAERRERMRQGGGFGGGN